MDIHIKIDSLEVKAVENSSGIFSGTNRQQYWSARSKSNQGLGKISGESNACESCINMINDNDFADMIIRPRAKAY